MKYAFMAFTGINVSSETRTVLEFCNDMIRKDVTVDRTYQRSQAIWPTTAQSYLIESILVGYPIPKLTLRQVADTFRKTSRREIVDGQQRTYVIFEFFNDRLRLSDKVDNSEFRKKTFSDLSDEDQTRFLNYRLSIDLFVGATDEDVRETFRRMNSYMAPLNSEEQRHAEFQGPFKWFVHRLAKDYSGLFEASGLFRSASLLRMQDTKLLTEILHAMHNGVQTTNKVTLGQIYRTFNQKYPNQKTDEFKLVTAFDKLFSWRSLFDSPIMKPYMVYSLILAIQYNLKLIDLPDLPIDSPRRIIGEPEINLSALADDMQKFQDGAEVEFPQFVAATEKSTNTKQQRMKRIEFFSAALADNLN